MYLEAPLFARHQEYMIHLANNAITQDGSDLVQAMTDNAEDLAHAVLELAPVEYGDLRNSGHPTVTDNGDVVYDRPPLARRLTEQELELKHRWLH